MNHEVLAPLQDAGHPLAETVCATLTEAEVEVPLEEEQQEVDNEEHQ